MIQLFFQAKNISTADWSVVYPKIVELLTAFPLTLVRLEAYNGYEKGLDKKHFNLQEGIGTIDERISFYGDWMSYTSGMQVTFYKNWAKQVEQALTGNLFEDHKPITWQPYQRFKDDGSFPDANGLSFCNDYINTNDAPYEYALIAVGILLENLLPTKVFLTAQEQYLENIQKVVEWLEFHFKQSFKRPLYFDKPRLLASFIHEYADKKGAVSRMEHLYRKQFKRNITFAIDHIGYEAAFDFYSEVLTLYSFGTYGFANVLDAWIAVTKDLESTLNLIAASKKLLIVEGTGEDWLARELAEYDLTKLLKKWLNNYLLWTPQQRELLDQFYTNKEALETGKEDLFGSLMQLSGYRVNICPMYATAEELFEAFMYHDPKNGKVFKQIIDDWLVKKKDAYAELVQKMEGLTFTKINHQPSTNTSKVIIDSQKNQLNQTIFINNYARPEQFFIKRALKANPTFLRIEAAIAELRNQFKAFIQAVDKQVYIQKIKAESKTEKIAFIRYRLKKLRLSIHSDFENWLVAETDESVLFHLRLLMGMKFTDRPFVYTCFRILWDRNYWEAWRNGSEYAV